MGAIIGVVIVFIFILLLSRKVSIGASLLAGGICLGLIFRIGWKEFLMSAGNALIDAKTLELAALIILILILNEALKTSKQLERLVEACRNILPDVRLVVLILPALIGLLPMPGGAYFSAPMVATSLNESKVTLERQAFANYWFRHIWEYIFPLYPGLAMLVKLSGVSFREIARVNVILTITALVYGVVVVFGHRSSLFRQEKQTEGFSFFWAKEFLVQFSPIILIVVCTLFLNVDVILSLILGLILVYFINHVDVRFIIRTLKKGFSPSMLLLIAGIMVFKAILSDCGAVDSVVSYLKIQGVGLLPILFVVPFLSGIVTGYTVALMGITLPIILPLLGEAQLPALMFLFASGFAGVLLSPVHACLILTREYFRANLLKMYAYMIPGAGAIIAVGLVAYFLLT